LLETDHGRTERRAIATGYDALANHDTVAVRALFAEDVTWAGPGNAQAEPREVDVARRATASVGHLTTGSPRTEQLRLTAPS
jgi:hypothetical protein